MHFILGFLGKTRSGKTWKMRKVLQLFRRVIVIDPQLQFPEYTQIRSIKEFIAYWNKQNHKNFRISIDLDDIDEYERIFELIYDYGNNLVVGVDEISLFADTFNIGDGLKNIIQRGGKKGINVIWNTQRPADVSKKVYSQTDFLVSFRLLDTRDVMQLPYQWRKGNREKELADLKMQADDYRIVRGDFQDMQELFGTVFVEKT